MKKCPYCAEEIQDEAIVCRYCGRDLTPQANPVEPAEPKKTSSGAVIFIIALVVLLVMFVIFSGGGSGSDKSSSSSSSTPRSLAWTACTVFIERQLGISTREAQRYSATKVSVTGDQYTVEIYYASVGSTYRCELLRHSNGDTELLSLKVK